MYRIIRRYILALCTILTLAACGVNAYPNAHTVPDTGGKPKLGEHATLLTIRAEGGLCMNTSCWSEKQIKVNGTFTATDSNGAQSTGTLDAAAVAQLTQLIAATDFEQLKSQPFTGICPLATDGQEFSYTFQTMSGPQTLASCAVAIDEKSPLFQIITDLLGEMYRA